LARASNLHPEDLTLRQFISEIQVKAGALEDAMRTAAVFDEREWRILTIGVGAQARHHATADLEHTLAILIPKIQGMEDRGIPVRLNRFADLAAVLGRAGYITKAREVLGLAQAIQRETVAWPQPAGLLAIARAQAAMGDGDAAFATLASGNRNFKPPDYASLAVEFAARGDTASTLDALSKGHCGDDRIRRDVALKLAEAGDAGAALSLARRITNATERFEVLVRLLAQPNAEPAHDR
jgi:hypothetical protein